MKKRLLSAVLALAMALTLLPMSVFAANIADNTNAVNPDDMMYTDSKGTHPFAGPTANDGYTTVTVTYQEKDDTATDRLAGKWYWLDNKNKDANGDYKYYYVSDGLVAGTGNSGLWYPDFAAFTKADESLRGTSFTMLDDVSVSTVLTNDNAKAPTTLTIDVNGHELTLPGTLPTKFSSLTVTNRKNPLTNSGSVTAIVKDTETRTSPAPTGVTYSNLTVTVSNTTVASIDLTGGSNTVTLNNVEVEGAISMDGHSATTATSSGTVTHAYGAQKLYVNNNGLNNLPTTTILGGGITIDNSDGSVVQLNNASGARQDVSVTGNGGSLTVNGASTLGAIETTSRGNAANATPASVTITSGSVGAITRGDDYTGGTGKMSTAKNKVTVGSLGSATSIDTPNGDVEINKGKVGTTVTVKAGSLKLTGPVTTGNVTLGERGAVELSVTNSSTDSGSKIAGIAVYTGKGANLKIRSWPTGPDARLNNFGVLDLGSYDERGVTGGTFAIDNDTATAPAVAAFKNTSNATWFSKDLQYVVTMDPANVALYGKTEMARAISDVTSSVAGATPAAGQAVAMHVLCNPDTNTLNLVFGDITWAKIGYNKPIGMILPELINNQPISVWTSGENDASVQAGKEEEIPEPAAGAANQFTLYANSVATTIVKSITNAAVSSSTTPVENQNVKVTVENNNIVISGAVKANPGTNIATIKLNLTTDALKNTGTTTGTGSGGYLVLEDVQVSYNVDTKAVSFNKLQKLDGGAIVNDLGELVLNNGTGTHYTVSARLAEPAPNLGLHDAGKLITAVVSGSLNSASQTYKNNIINQIAGTGAEFDINGNRAVLEAINAIQAQYTSKNTVSGWVTQAQNYVWTNGNSYKNPTTGQPLDKGKGVGDLNGHTGKLTTTGTFGTDGSTIQTRYAKAYIVPFLEVNVTNMNQNGTLNATLTIKYRIDVSTDGAYTPTEYYTVQTGTLGALTGDMATKPVKVKFNNLGADFTGSNYIHQDGKYVYEKNAAEPADNTDNTYVTETQYAGWLINHAGTGNGSLGSIVLNAVSGPITITSDIANRAPGLLQGASYDDLQAAVNDTVAGLTTQAAGGTTRTKDTITIGGTYKKDCTITMDGIARMVAVVAEGQQKVSSNTNNVSSTTVNGIDYVLELKADTVVAGNVVLTVQGVEDGTASLPKNTAKVGEKVTVTVLPKEGKVTKGITVKTNKGDVVQAKPTGVTNQYEFVVPQSVTSITVTPNFTKASELPFTDVATTDSFYNAVKWNYEHNFVRGTTDTTFRPHNYITRAQMVTILYRNAGSPAVNVTSYPYSDINVGSVDNEMRRAIVWATNAGIVEGYGDGTFGPSNTIRKQELAKILYQYNRYRGGSTSGTVNLSNTFTDASSIGSWATSYVQWAVANGVMGAASGKQFLPQQTLVRYQAAEFVYNYGLKYIG